MNKLLIAVLALFSTQAFAANQTALLGNTIGLLDCGGLVSTKLNHNGQLEVRLDEINACSIFSIIRSDDKAVAYQDIKLMGENHHKMGSFTIPMNLMGERSVTISLRSGSGATSDTLKIKLPAKKITASHTISLGNTIALNSNVCGGLVETNTGNGSQLNVVFKNLRDCSMFDIVRADGVKTQYADKVIPGSFANYSGSFSIGKKFLGEGFSSVTVVAKSADGTRQEFITINYLRF